MSKFKMQESGVCENRETACQQRELEKYKQLERVLRSRDADIVEQAVLAEGFDKKQLRAPNDKKMATVNATSIKQAFLFAYKEEEEKRNKA